MQWFWNVEQISGSFDLWMDGNPTNLRERQVIAIVNFCELHLGMNKVSMYLSVWLKGTPTSISLDVHTSATWILNICPPKIFLTNLNNKIEKGLTYFMVSFFDITNMCNFTWSVYKF